MYQLAAPKAIRRGVTMIELLVVVTIMVMLAAIAIPSMRFLSEGRRIREATRAVGVYFGNARNRAAETGRPVGVLFERLERQPHASVLLRQVEVPPPFAGNLLDSVVRVIAPFPGTGVVRVQVRVTDFANQLIRRGDLVQLNHQGPWYRIIDYDDGAGPDLDFPIDSVNPSKEYVDFSAGTTSDGVWIDSHLLSLQITEPGVDPPWGVGALTPFQILRQPMPSSVAPLQLSRGAVVDLAASGFDSLLPDWDVEQVAHDFEPEMPLDLRPVIVMFSPTGAVDRVYYTRREYLADGSYDHCAYFGRSVVEPIYFLVGKWERLALSPRPINVTSPPPMPPALAEDGIYNRQDTSNLWVMLNPQTGLVTVADLNGDTYDPGTGMEIPSGATFSEQLSVARRLVREAQISKGGR